MHEYTRNKTRVIVHRYKCELAESVLVLFVSCIYLKTVQCSGYSHVFHESPTHFTHVKLHLYFIYTLVSFS